MFPLIVVIFSAIQVKWSKCAALVHVDSLEMVSLTEIEHYIAMLYCYYSIYFEIDGMNGFCVIEGGKLILS